jgi:hypothetical protein
VGRLRLSFLGFAEPRFGKCNDLRLFCILNKNADYCLEGEKLHRYKKQWRLLWLHITVRNVGENLKGQMPYGVLSICFASNAAIASRSN